MVDEQFITRWAERLAREIPGALAVLLKGSYVRGDAGPWSDVDFDVLVDDTEIVDPYLSWFDATAGRLVHVSVAVEPLVAWLEEFAEPAPWAFGFAGRPVTKLLWVARPSLAAELDRPWRSHVPGDPELEDFIESLGKARNAMFRGDDLAVRLALRDVGLLAPSLLVPLNDGRFPSTKPQALHMALDVEVAPPGYRADLLALLGFDGQGHTVPDLLAIAERLVSGMLHLLAAHAATMDSLLAPHLAPALSEGVLARYLDQPTTPDTDPA
jgi:hypothetical protein